MISNRCWPSWHPGDELRAELLLGLEDYLLARAAITDELLYGVERFNWQSWLKVKWQPDGLSFAVIGLLGVTPAGEPVVVSEEAQLTHVVAMPAEQPGAGLSEARAAFARFQWDISIEVNRRVPNAEENSHGDGEADIQAAVPAKLELVVRVAEAGDAMPPRQAHHLYLGRYATSEDGHRQVKPPMVRRLCSSEPRDDDWMKWVAPLHKRIQNLVDQVSGPGPAGSGPHQTLVSDVVHLAFEWPSLTIPILARRLQLISWLNGRIVGPIPVDDYASSLPMPFPWATLDAADVPGALADLLPRTLHVTARPTIGSNSAEVTMGRELLVAISEHDIDFFAPIGLLARFVSDLDRLSASDDLPSQGALNALCVPKAAGTGSGESPWHKVVRLLCAAHIEQRLGNACSPEQLVCIVGTGGGSLVVAAARAFDQILAGPAEQRRAGPIGAYWIARALALCQGVQRELQPVSRSYLSRVLGEHGHPMQGGSGNLLRSLGYLGLVDVRAQAGVAASASRGTAGRTLPGGGKVQNQPARVVVLGPVRAGKSGIVAAFRQIGMPMENVRGVTKGFDLDFSEINISADTALTPAEKEQILSADLIVVALHPNYIATLRMATAEVREMGFLEAIGSTGSRAAIAIVYSRADEYGVVTAPTQRVLSSTQIQQVAKLPNLESWNAMLTQPGAHKRRDGWARLGTGAINHTQECGPTRMWVLEQTRPFWDAAAKAAVQGRFLNAYFVCATPVDTRFKGLDQRGLNPLIDDFSQYLHQH